jgi:D-sedoheptulose 7-phosphate isomerase
MKEIIEAIIRSSIDVKYKLLETEVSNIENAARSIQESLNKSGKLLIFGNGGSAADSQHIAAEFVGRFRLDREALPALALTTNTSTLTALSNDYGYDITFKRQIESLGNKGDVALAISTSGNAKNVVEAIKRAKQKGLITIGLTGRDGGMLKPLCDITIVVTSNETARIQESHILVGHIIAEIVEAYFAKQ